MMKQKGFTLVEIVLSIALISILVFITALLLRQGLDSYSHVSQRASNLQYSRYAMERMIRELKRLGDKSSNNLQNISATRVTFTDDQGNTTSFNLNGQQLLRGNDLLLDHVTSLAFTGYRDTNAVTSSAQQTRRINIQLSTLPPGQSTPLTLRTDIFFRNYMYENYQ